MRPSLLLVLLLAVAAWVAGLGGCPARARMQDDAAATGERAARTLWIGLFALEPDASAPPGMRPALPHSAWALPAGVRWLDRSCTIDAFSGDGRLAASKTYDPLAGAGEAWLRENAQLGFEVTADSQFLSVRAPSFEDARVEIPGPSDTPGGGFIPVFLVPR